MQVVIGCVVILIGAGVLWRVKSVAGVLIGWAIMSSGGLLIVLSSEMHDWQQQIKDNPTPVQIVGVAMVLFIMAMLLGVRMPHGPKRARMSKRRREPMGVIVSHEPTQAELRAGDR